VVDGENFVPKFTPCLIRWPVFPTAYAAGEWKDTRQANRNVINIGIGGSDLGPVMAYEAPTALRDRSVTFRFVSNIDEPTSRKRPATSTRGDALYHLLERPSTTLETMTNATSGARLGSQGVNNPPRSHGISSQSPQNARSDQVWYRLGEHVEFLGLGRRTISMDSAIGLSTMIAIDPGNSRDASTAFTRWTSISGVRPFDRNLPVLLVSWASEQRFPRRRNSGGASVRTYLKRFPAYLQH